MCSHRKETELPSSSRNRKRRQKSQRRSVNLLTILGCIAGAFCLVVVLACVVGATWLIGLPDYSTISSYANTGITTIYANDRETVLAKLYLENRIEVTQDEVVDYVLEGTIATEDERFYEHGGIDPIGIARAVIVNAASRGASEGASTITQQLVRNTVLSDEQFDKTIRRKVREAYIAVEMEKMYSKDQILLMYLNTIYYGHGAYGIEAAKPHVLQQARERAHARRGRHAHRPAQLAVLLRPHAEPRRRQGAPQQGA